LSSIGKIGYAFLARLVHFLFRSAVGTNNKKTNPS
jgi:hypothetical protein